MPMVSATGGESTARGGTRPKAHDVGPDPGDRPGLRPGTPLARCDRLGAVSETNPVPGPAALREPANLVSPRAVAFWRTSALVGVGDPVDADRASGTHCCRNAPGGRPPSLVLVVAVTLARVVVMPTVRYRIHRWEVTPTAVFTRIRLADPRGADRPALPGADRRLPPGRAHAAVPAGLDHRDHGVGGRAVADRLPRRGGGPSGRRGAHRDHRCLRG